MRWSKEEKEAQRVEEENAGGAGGDAGGGGGDGTVYFSSVCSKDGSGQRKAPTHQGDLPTLTIFVDQISNSVSTFTFLLLLKKPGTVPRSSLHLSKALSTESLLKEYFCKMPKKINLSICLSIYKMVFALKVQTVEDVKIPKN